MTTFRKFAVDLNGFTIQSVLLSISAGLILLLLASGCGAPVPDTAGVALQSTATPGMIATATPLRPIASPSNTPSSSRAADESLDENDARPILKSHALHDAVRAQLASYSFRIAHEHNQTTWDAEFGVENKHTYTATADVVLPGKMHMVMVSNIFLPETGPISEAIYLDDVVYRNERQSDMSYRWVKSTTRDSPLNGFQMAYSFWDHAEEFVLSGTDLVDGSETDVYEYVYEGKFGGARFKQTEKVWVSSDDGVLRKVEHTRKTFDGYEKQASMAIDYLTTFLFYDYNADIRIEAPTDDE